jgi:hypothetical protein
MFGKGYALGVIVTTLGMYAWNKWKLMVEKFEQEEKEYE